MAESDLLPHNSVTIRFGTATPYFLMAMGYGIFIDPNTRLPFLSVDHYIGMHMFVRSEHRQRIMSAPNGYIAHRNILSIIDTAKAYDGHEVVSPTWEEDRDSVMFEALRLKYTQSSCLQEMLLRTGDRPIYDASRAEDCYWCWADGRGRNRHAELLMELRTKLRSGVPIPPREC